ncbi:YidH family protein [Sinomonas atrocyanea]|uniref:YidH family protein n=1 Tax=Sinomonas atrocyanea TaxID=37927 RepID=UPI003D9869C6
MREPAWRKTGSTPDYRFSLANERTFLAWLRTSLALLAGAVALDQLTPNIAPPIVRGVLSVALAGVGAALAVNAYRRWSLAEQAMRHGRELPFSRVMLAMTIVVAIAAFVFAVLVLMRP